MSTVEVRVRDGRVPVPDELHLVEPLPGLPGRTALRLTPLDEQAALFTLRSLPGDEPLRLFVVAPDAFFADYTPDAAALRGALGLGEQDAEPTVLAVVHPADDERPAPTVNLVAPVVVDPRDGRAVQVLLDEPWPLRAELR